MDKKIKLLYTQDILRQSAQCFGIRVDSILELNGFQNFVYSGVVGDREVILRIAHVTHRNELLTRAELDFIMFLADCGMKVARPIQSLSGDLIHIIDESFVVTAFEKAPGKNAVIAEESNTFYENIGQMVGKIHKFSFNYSSQHSRYEWNDNALLASFKKYCPLELHDNFDRLITEVSALAKEKIRTVLFMGISALAIILMVGTMPLLLIMMMRNIAGLFLILLLHYSMKSLFRGLCLEM